ncbi:MAG: acyltransferase [Muribaculaceae bacterium]|nr:acyltransferase [Muribaculaceae bacterium]
MSEKLPLYGALRGWRGVMALVTVCFHMEMHAFDQAVHGAVSFFFILSGFLLELRHDFASRPGSESRWAFVWTRCRRLYPLHWMGLAGVVLIYAVFHCRPINGWLVVHIALLQSWVPCHDVQFGYSGLGWFFGTILFCYACFPTLQRAFNGRRLRLQVATVAVAALALSVALPQLPASGRDWFYTLPVVRLCDFVLGMTLARAYRRLLPLHGLTASRVSRASLAEVAVVAAAALTLFADRHCAWLLPWNDFLLYWPCMGLLVLVFALTQEKKGVVSRLLCVAPMQWLGALSAEIFALQFVASLWVNWLLLPVVFHFTGVSLYGHYSWIMLVFVVLLAMAWATHRWVSPRLRRAAE